jgi:hypothetical protein
MHHYLYSVSDSADPRFHATAVIEDEVLLIDIRSLEGYPGRYTKIVVSFRRLQSKR